MNGRSLTVSERTAVSLCLPYCDPWDAKMFQTTRDDFENETGISLSQGFPLDSYAIVAVLDRIHYVLFGDGLAQGTLSTGAAK